MAEMHLLAKASLPITVILAIRVTKTIDPIESIGIVDITQTINTIGPVHHLLLLHKPICPRLRLYLCQPRGRRDARLIRDGREQWRQRLEKIPYRCRRIGAITLSTGVPDVDFWLQPVDSLGVCLGQFFVCVALKHHVVHETLYNGLACKKLCLCQKTF